MCVINLLFKLFLFILCAYVLSSVQSSLFEIKLAVSFSAMHFFQIGGLVLSASVLSARCMWVIWLWLNSLAYLLPAIHCQMNNYSLCLYTSSGKKVVHFLVRKSWPSATKTASMRQVGMSSSYCGFIRPDSLTSYPLFWLNYIGYGFTSCASYDNLSIVVKSGSSVVNGTSYGSTVDVRSVC